MKRISQMQRVFLLCCLVTTIAGCLGNNYDNPQKQLGIGAHTPKQQERPVEEYLSPEFKQWLGNLGGRYIRGQASKADIKIESCIPLHTQLVIPHNESVIVVNISDEYISFGGDGALSKHVAACYNHDKWFGLRLPPAPPNMWAYGGGGVSTPLAPGQRVPAGEYAISDMGTLFTRNGNIAPGTRSGEIYHAVLPKVSETTSLSDAQSKVKTLYYNILKRASQHTGYLVLPAISTAVFSAADYTKLSFTKNQFIAAMYEGMYQGIKQYIDEPPGSSLGTCCIILNNWEPSIADA